MLNFPPTPPGNVPPAIGDVFPDPPIPGVPQWRWNGVAWASVSLDGGFPSGTGMLFYQASAPLGWTKLTDQNDKALRVVSGIGGVAGGTNSFSSVMAQTVVGAHWLTLAQIPAGISSHWGGYITSYPGAPSPAMTFPIAGGDGWNYFNGEWGTWTAGVPASATAGSGTHTNFSQAYVDIYSTSQNTGGGWHNHSITLGLAYVDIIIAIKD